MEAPSSSEGLGHQGGTGRPVCEVVKTGRLPKSLQKQQQDLQVPPSPPVRLLLLRRRPAATGPARSFHGKAPGPHTESPHPQISASSLNGSRTDSQESPNIRKLPLFMKEKDKQMGEGASGEGKGTSCTEEPESRLSRLHPGHPGGERPRKGQREITKCMFYHVQESVSMC